MVAEQDVPAGLLGADRVSMSPLGAEAGCLVAVAPCVPCPEPPEPLRLQGTSGDFPVLRVEARETVGVQHAFWGTASSGEEGLRRGFCPNTQDHTGAGLAGECRGRGR